MPASTPRSSLRAGTTIETVGQRDGSGRVGRERRGMERTLIGKTRAERTLIASDTRRRPWRKALIEVVDGDARVRAGPTRSGGRRRSPSLGERNLLPRLGPVGR